MASGTCMNDDSFGPAVQGCRGDFDFTQKFQRIFFSIIPAAVFISLALARVAVLSQRPRIVSGFMFRLAKLMLLIAYSATRLAVLVIFSTRPPSTAHGLVLASACLTFIASLVAVVLSFFEHSRSQRPSILLGIYLLIGIIFGIVQTRTAWLVIAGPPQTTLARLFTASLAAKAFILGLEASPKTRWTHWDAGEHSPEEFCGFFSLGVYFWLNRLFIRGFRGVLVIDDLYPLDCAMTAEKMTARLENRIDTQTYRKNPKIALLKDVCRALVGPVLLPIAPRAALIAFKFCQPLLIKTLLQYLQSSNEARKEEHGYGLIGACAIIYVGIVVSTALYQYFNQRALYMVRGSLVTAIYKKTVEVRASAADDSAALTLMSTDIQNIVEGAKSTHDIWANTIEVAVGCWLLQGQIGVAFVSPVGIIATCAAALILVVRLVGKRQRNWMSKIQERVGLTANAIANMKLYKISGITGPVAELIQGLRLREILVGNQYRWLLVLSAVLGVSPLSLSPVVTFAVTSSKLDVTVLYTALSYIFLVTLPLSQMFQNIPDILAALACLQRIQNFLASEPRDDFREFSIEQRTTCPDLGDKANLTTGKASSSEADLAYLIADGSFGWGGSRMTLSRINARIPAKALTLVVGPVASGKSTFCKVLLGEMPVHHGRVNNFFPSTPIGYCVQTPFLYNATLKKNIIGHHSFNQQRYDEAIDATLLASDAAFLPGGHETKIGSNGIMLSGGQKQRTTVARALYSDAPVLIFDDILSGLDAQTESEVFRRVFGPSGAVRRRNATAVVCTHSVKHLPAADHIIALGSDGTVVEEGRFQDLMDNNKYVYSLGVKAVTGNSAKKADSTAEATTPLTKAKSKAAYVSTLEDKARQAGDWSVYMHYFRSTDPLTVSLLVVCGVFWGFCDNFATVWINFWAADSFDHPDSFYIGIYGLLKVFQVLALFCIGTTALIPMITISGNILHERAISTVVSAPLRFFATTDSGVVTNHFSQDMTLIDGELPLAFVNVALALFQLVGMIFVVAAASPYLAIAYPFLFAILYVLQKFYLRTSRQLRLLDLEAKSPLYTHFIDTIKGIATIRAFGWGQADVEVNHRLLNTSQRPAYLLAMIQRWLTATLQLMVAGLAVVLVSLATQLRAGAGLTGASLVTLLSFGETVASVITRYTDLETTIGAVSRLRTFSETVEPEDQPGEDFEPPSEWPQSGRIEIQGVSASYGSDIEPQGDAAGPSSPPGLVLRNLTLEIAPGQKVAVCGRTGSGKSSLILLLLRLLDPLPSSPGNMSLDGVPLARIDRTTLRQRVIAIPQDAVFLPNGSTVRHNIDPLAAATDAECLSVLDAVGLAGFVTDRGGLAAGMGADDLSAGQKQLFSLGRAILRRRVRERERQASGGEKGGVEGGGVLLLDEVSSSVDVAADRAMQEIIRAEFAAYTIIMVSHRLEMVVDFFDRVVVLDKGALVELGRPVELIETPGSRFGQLWALGNRG